MHGGDGRGGSLSWNGIQVDAEVLAGALAATMRARKQWDGRPLRLVICYAGTGGAESIAARVLTELDRLGIQVELYAADGTVFDVPAAGRQLVVASYVGVRASGIQAVVPGDGGWVRFRLDSTGLVIEPMGGYLEPGATLPPRATVAPPGHEVADGPGTLLPIKDMYSWAKFLFKRLTPTSSAVTVTNPGQQVCAKGGVVGLDVKASTTNFGQTLSYSASGLPAGLSISSTTGTISGRPT